MTGEAGPAGAEQGGQPGRLTSTVDLLSGGGGAGTTVTESVELHSPAPLRRFALGQARSVQRSRAAELTRRMAAGNAG
jgi:hypothetical protein